jgi:hypothetical protein
VIVPVIHVQQALVVHAGLTAHAADWYVRDAHHPTHPLLFTRVPLRVIGASPQRFHATSAHDASDDPRVKGEGPATQYAVLPDAVLSAGHRSE